MSTALPTRWLSLAAVLVAVAACGPNAPTITTETTESKTTLPKTKGTAAPLKTKSSAPTAIVPSATPTPSPTPTASPTASPTPTATPTASPTASPASSATPSAGPSASASPTPAASGTPAPGGLTKADLIAEVGFPFEPLNRTWVYDAAVTISGFPITADATWKVRTVDAVGATIETTLPVPIGPPQTQELTFTRDYTDSKAGLTHVYSRETITVPLGTFECILDASDDGKGNTNKTWFAKDKGVIQSMQVTAQGSGTFKLKTFTP